MVESALVLAPGTELVLKLQTWTVVEPLAGDGGGFGDLYVVRDASADIAVAKLVEKAPGAEREIYIGTAIQASEFSNVVPVLDDGDHGESWVLVMPKAEMSLAAFLESSELPLPVDQAVKILRDIAKALAAINGTIVHRDVKPQNVLLLDSEWCLADFGISRYAEATTAENTRQGFLSRPYAAPEQWRMERAVPATDVYAFGCVGYQLLAGEPPFLGPDFRTQHLYEQPPDVRVGSTRLRVLIEECLYKPAESRPTPTAILARLDRIADEPARGASKLAEANRQVVRKNAAEQAAQSAEEQARERRNTLHKTASAAFRRIADELVEAIVDAAPSAAVNDPRILFSMPNPFDSLGLVNAQLAGVRLGVSEPKFSLASSVLPFEVISEAEIGLIMPQPRHSWIGRLHSLWYCDAVDKGRFAWYETAFMSSPFLAQRSNIEPFSRTAKGAEASLLPGIGTEQVAWPFEELDRSDLSEFVDRWLGWFGEAAQGQLFRPGTMPEKPIDGSWRRR